jgi:hypothetical protein
MFATIADAHREWHINAGVPMGLPGCPQDACHVPEFDTDEEGDAWFAQFPVRDTEPVIEEEPPTCEHGMSAWLCAGPGHYPMD